MEFDWSDGGIIGKRDLQFGLFVSQASDWKSYWDPTNDYSREGITETFADTQLIPVYHNGELEYGIEPPGPSVTTEPTPAPTPVGGLLGDVNTSGNVDIVDALLVAQYYVGLDPENFDPGAADVSRDGSIDIIDALLIVQCYVGLVSCDF